MSSYKLVQYLRDYVNLEGEKFPIEIKSRIGWNWFHWLGFKYKDIKKDVFVDKHEQTDMVEDQKRFLKKMKKLKSYMVEFNENGIIKDKKYLLNYIVSRKV